MFFGSRSVGIMYKYLYILYKKNMETKFYNDGVTIISITTIILGCLVMSLKILFKSKCKDVNICFGLLKIKRTVELENDIW